MSAFGKVKEFEGSKEDWPQYVEQLGHFFAANDITEDDKKKKNLLGSSRTDRQRLIYSGI